MRHVDEGTIHAWLDRQISDPIAAARVEEHLRGCSACAARLAEERATFEQAQALLAAAAGTAQGRPSFEELEARAASAAGARSSEAESQAAVRTWLFPLAQAAVIVLAVGIGWMARELTDRDAPATQAAAAPSARPPQPPVPSAAPPRSDRQAVPPSAGSNASAPAVQQRAESQSRPRAGAAVTPERRVAGGVTPPAPAAAANEAAPARDAAALFGAAPPLAPEARAEAVELSSAAAPLTVTGSAPAAPAAVAPLPSAARPVLGGIVGRGLTQSVAPLPMQVGEWQSLPRTEAAARTGMPLYGIAGMEPVLTSITADGSRVRTTYQLPAGGLVELIQERFPARLAEAVAVQETARTGRGGARGGVTADQLAAAREWSTVKGDVRVTLRTTALAADIDALGAKLRVD